MAQIPGPWVTMPAMIVAKVTTRDHPKRTDGRKRARFRPAQRVGAVAVTQKFPLWATRQIDMPREYITSVVVALTRVALALPATNVITPVPGITVCLRPLSAAARSSAERPCVAVALA